MNIGLLHYSVPPVVGGVESVIAHHARLMCSAGHSVHIIAGRGSQFDNSVVFHQQPLVDSLHPDILEIKTQLDKGIVPSGFFNLVNTIQSSLKPVFDELDVLIAHNVCSLAKNLALTAALKHISQEQNKPRMIIWHHDLAWTTPRYRSELHEGYPWDLLRTDWQDTTQVVVSKLRHTELCRLFNVPGERIHVVPNGVDIIKFFKMEEITLRFIQQFSLEQAEPLFLLPVRITRRKNIEQAIQITASLRNLFNNPVLLITGPLGPHNPTNSQYFDQLKQLRDELKLHNSVYFAADLFDGYLADEVISDFYHLADALLMPSREEGFGIPLIEAGLVRMPVFCSNITPLKELGMDQVTYFSPDDKAEKVAGQIYKKLTSLSSFQLQLRIRHSYSWNAIYRNQISPLLIK